MHNQAIFLNIYLPSFIFFNLIKYYWLAVVMLYIQISITSYHVWIFWVN